MDRYSTGSSITKGNIIKILNTVTLEKDEQLKKEDAVKPVNKEEEKAKKELSLKEIDDKFMTIDDFLDNFN